MPNKPSLIFYLRPTPNHMNMLTRKARRYASEALLSLLLGHSIVLYFDDDDRRSYLRRSLQLQRKWQDETGGPRRSNGRTLAIAGTSPPALDEIPGEYLVKPWVGYAQDNVYETTTALIDLHSAQSSTNEGMDYLPRYAIQPHPLKWASSSDHPREHEWMQIDTGYPQQLEEIEIRWDEQAYAVDYTIEVGPERLVCRPSMRPCADYWIPVVSVTGKSDSSPSVHAINNYDAPQGVRYVRIVMTRRAPNQQNFAMYRVKVYRAKEVVGQTPTSHYCGATTSAVASSLLSLHGGSLLQTFEIAEYFSATLTPAQADAVNTDPCTFAAEPNYVVRARGRDAAAEEGERRMRRRLAIPEFNMRDESPPNWGLERISSHGRRNGKYTWFHEGEGTHLYMFDTGIYPDHSEWIIRDGSSRLTAPTVCAGASGDYVFNDHGTHAASIAAGWTYGPGKSAVIHPIQVLDKEGAGSTASFLCGLEKVLQDVRDHQDNHPDGEEKYQAVVNLSLGVNGRSDILDKAVQEMTDAGIIVVIAVGDSNANACFYSPMHTTALRVGALRDDPEGFNNKTDTSNFGQCVDVWAPGEDIQGASNEGEYEGASKSGTSVAAAFASGAAALFLESTNTEELQTNEVAAIVKEKMLAKAENYILGEVGHGSTAKMLQTTVSKCSQNQHCEAGLTCLFDGTCRDLSKPLTK